MPELSLLAQSQLKAWEKIADSWVIQVVGRGGISLNCPACDTDFMNVVQERAEIRGIDHISYVLTPGEIRAATVAHLRNRHRDLDPDE